MVTAGAWGVLTRGLGSAYQVLPAYIALPSAAPGRVRRSGKVESLPERTPTIGCGLLPVALLHIACLVPRVPTYT